MPPGWTPLDEPRRLEQDKGDYFRDRNAARFPTYPLEPAVRAILSESESLDTRKIDLFACSSTMGSLLRFVRRVNKPFRFFVEVVGTTVFFIRHENSPTELISGVRGYGHTFPEAYTTWDADVKGSASHQRLLSYNFAGLNCILRFECDGYLGFKGPGGVKIPATTSDQQKAKEKDDLASILDGMKIRSGGGEGRGGPLQIKEAGQKIPQEAVFDLKTRAGWRKDLTVLEDELPRFWVAQIPNFILARHDAGVFNDINVQHISDDVKKWQQESQTDLRRLDWLLQKIIAVAKARKDGKLEVCCKSLETLELREQDTDEHNVLPSELKLRWMGDSASKEPGLAEDEEYESDPNRDWYGSGHYSDEESDQDFTACSADSCGYCGHCSY
ncbi:MAG: hypothetical protein M1815_002709 [Lichina confinis]|nr:MAG: hypothetical protein M1815_002709 [Lichina confinis]